MREKILGVILALGAFSIWGCYPLLWSVLKQDGAQPLEILSHRIIWAHLFGWLTIATLKASNTDQRFMPRRPRTWAICAASGGLNVVNWMICIWASTSGKLVEASFGYFLAPLLATALGVVIYRERLVSMQKVAIGLAACTIAAGCFLSGRFPWVALTAASTAAGYAAVRKYVEPQAIAGMLVETALFVPVGAAYLIWTRLHGGGGVFWTAPTTTGACLLAGLVTALAIVFYAGAATRLRLSTLGIMQYIYPCAQFFLGVFVFHESMDSSSWVTLGGIALALVIYSWATVSEMLTVLRNKRAAVANRLRNARAKRKPVAVAVAVAGEPSTVPGEPQVS